MGRAFIFNTLLTAIFILMLPPLVRANVPILKEMTSDFSFLVDTVGQQQQDKKQEKSKGKPDSKQAPDKPVIRAVPKARKQSRPPVVVKPNIKVKPIKVIRPNIKRP